MFHPYRCSAVGLDMRLLSVLCVVVALGGCGSLLGEYAGSQIGKGKGKTAAETAASAIGGGVLGHALSGK